MGCIDCGKDISCGSFTSGDVQIHAPHIDVASIAVQHDIRLNRSTVTRP